MTLRKNCACCCFLESDGRRTVVAIITVWFKFISTSCFFFNLNLSMTSPPWELFKRRPSRKWAKGADVTFPRASCWKWNCLSSSMRWYVTLRQRQWAVDGKNIREGRQRNVVQVFELRIIDDPGDLIQRSRFLAQTQPLEVDFSIKQSKAQYLTNLYRIDGQGARRFANRQTITIAIAALLRQKWLAVQIPWRHLLSRNAFNNSGDLVI